MKKILTTIFALLILFIFSPKTFARENVNYWYIKNLDTVIKINNDSSLDIEENIIADCGSAQKHGIYRVLLLFQQLTKKGRNNNYIDLISITDFNGKPYEFEESKTKDTITWKIGDADIYVTGANNYRIKYKVKNAVLHNSSDFDELYWNLNGAFWDLEIDSFHAKVIFPNQITKNTSQTNIYSGDFKDKNALDIGYTWTDNNTIEVNYGKTLKTGEAITLSTTFDKGITSPYVPTFLERYGNYLYLIIPIFMLMLAFYLWNKYGKDPKINPIIAPEFEIPENLSPIDMGLVLKDGLMKNNFLSASIINLAVGGYIKIKKLDKNDFELIKIKSPTSVSSSEKELFESLFKSSKSVTLSSLKNKFYTNIPAIKNQGINYLVKKGWLVKNSRSLQYTIAALGAGCFFLFIFLAKPLISNFYLGSSILISGLILILFSPFMKRRTLEGAKLERRIQGFKLYMETAEKYRQKFNEEKGLFEKFLPYAILFGITKQWIKKMKDIYGAKYMDSYHPIWFIGPAFSDLNIYAVANEISSMSSNMASTISSSPSSSGSGGGGFSGGGGGGGGGGGW